MQRNEVVKVGSHEIREIKWKGQRVITTAQLADVYETDINNVQMNYANNKRRFEEGAHYFYLEGDELREFKMSLPNDIGDPLKFASRLYLWTHRGASRHCKILDTEKAWEQFDNLEEAYFSPRPQPATITYQYPVASTALESATNAGRLFERIMKSEGSAPHEIMAAVRFLFLQAGIDVPEFVVKIPAYEQLSMDILVR